MSLMILLLGGGEDIHADLGVRQTVKAMPKDSKLWFAEGSQGLVRVTSSSPVYVIRTFTIYG